MVGVGFVVGYLSYLGVARGALTPYPYPYPYFTLLPLLDHFTPRQAWGRHRFAGSPIAAPLWGLLFYILLPSTEGTGLPHRFDLRPKTGGDTPVPPTYSTGSSYPSFAPPSPPRRWRSPSRARRRAALLGEHARDAQREACGEQVRRENPKTPPPHAPPHYSVLLVILMSYGQ